MHKYHKSCFEFIWPFYGFLELYEIKLRRSHNFMSSVQKYHKSCFKLNWPFSIFLHLFELKSSKLSYFRELSAQASQIVFWANMTVFRLITTVWGKTSKISYLREFSAQVLKVVFWTIFVRLTAYYNYMKKTFKNLISPWVRCTSITNRVLRSFDRFAVYSNCMR